MFVACVIQAFDDLFRTSTKANQISPPRKIHCLSVNLNAQFQANVQTNSIRVHSIIDESNKLRN